MGATTCSGGAAIDGARPLPALSTLQLGFEKMCERGVWTQVFPCVERCNDASPMLSNVGYALACEKLLGVDVPDRCQWYRTALGELSRIADHLTCNGAMAMEVGAFGPCFWMMGARDVIYDIMEEETGARLTHGFSRVGGSLTPPTSGFKVTTRASLQQILSCVREVEKLLFLNRIFMDRLEEIGVVSADDAISLGWTGPYLRASGVPYDVRKAHPYLRYADVEFDVPIGTTGDALDRFIVRLEEMKQSARIVLQCCDRMPESGPMNIDDSRGVRALPAGEAYSYTEAGNGELGFYLVSDGSGTPYRVHIRRPCLRTTTWIACAS